MPADPPVHVPEIIFQPAHTNNTSNNTSDPDQFVPEFITAPLTGALTFLVDIVEGMSRNIDNLRNPPE
jgi:hypothetical protein